MSKASARQVSLASSDVSSGRSPRKVRERREKEKPARQVLLKESELTDEEEERRGSKGRPRLLPAQTVSEEPKGKPSVGPASLVPAPLVQGSEELAGQRSSGPPALVPAPVLPPASVKGSGKPGGVGDQSAQSSASGGGSTPARPGIGGIPFTPVPEPGEGTTSAGPALLGKGPDWRPMLEPVRGNGWRSHAQDSGRRESQARPEQQH